MPCMHERVDEDYILGSWSFCKNCGKEWSNDIHQEWTQQQFHVKKRSLAELDDAIDEIIQRNPEFLEEINKIIDSDKNERTN